MSTDTKLNSAIDDDENDFEIEIVDGDESNDENSDGGNNAPVAKNEATRASRVDDDKDDDRERLKAELAQERSARERAERERDETNVSSTAKIAAAEARQAEVQRESAKGLLSSIDTKIQAAREAIKIAKREDNQDLAWEAEDKLNELRRYKEKIENDVLPNIPDPAQIQSRAREAAAARSARPDGTPINEHTSARNSMAVQWAANNPWMSDQRAATAARFLSDQIASEGIRPDDPAHFAELTKRVGAAFPKIAVKGINPATPKGAGSPPVGNSRSSASGKVDSNKVKLDSADFATMRKYKMNPKDPKAQRAYAKAKREIALEGTRSNGN